MVFGGDMPLNPNTINKFFFFFFFFSKVGVTPPITWEDKVFMLKGRYF